jgi:hypothetical protein
MYRTVLAVLMVLRCPSTDSDIRIEVWMPLAVERGRAEQGPRTGVMLTT